MPTTPTQPYSKREAYAQRRWNWDEGLQKPDGRKLRAGGQWTWPRVQFQALYINVGSFEEALELQPLLAPWPVTAEGDYYDDPPKHVVWGWCRAIDLGEEALDEKFVKRMEKKIEMHFRTMARKTITESGAAVRKLAQMAKDGELATDKQVQLLYAANAHNYGLGNYGQFLKNTAPQGPQEIRIGRLNLNAGEPPKRRVREPKAKRIAAPVIDGEYREVDGNSDST